MKLLGFYPFEPSAAGSGRVRTASSPPGCVVHHVRPQSVCLTSNCVRSTRPRRAGHHRSRVRPVFTMPSNEDGAVPAPRRFVRKHCGQRSARGRPFIPLLPRPDPVASGPLRGLDSGAFRRRAGARSPRARMARARGGAASSRRRAGRALAANARRTERSGRAARHRARAWAP